METKCVCSELCAVESPTMTPGREYLTIPLCFVLLYPWRQEPAECQVPKLSRSKLCSISKINECNKEIESNFVMIWNFCSVCVPQMDLQLDLQAHLVKHLCSWLKSMHFFMEQLLGSS